MTYPHPARMTPQEIDALCSDLLRLASRSEDADKALLRQAAAVITRQSIALADVRRAAA